MRKNRSFWAMLIFAMVTLFVTIGETAANAAEVSRVPALRPMDPPPDDTDPDQGGGDGWFGSGDDKCRHLPSTLYVPRDIDGYAFNWYCRNGKKGILRRRFEDKVNGNHASIKELKTYAAEKAEINGLFNFDDLKEEPCEVFQKYKADIEQAQCVRIKSSNFPKMADEAGKETFLKPCEQWEKLIRDLAKKGEAQPYSSADRENISYCNSENPIFQKVFKVMSREDRNAGYDVHDYTGPQSLVEPLGSLISIGTWLAMAMCVIGVLICAGKMALAYRGGGEEAVTGLIVVLVACVLAGAAIGITQMALVG